MLGSCSNVKIWVAAGTYKPDCNSADPNGSGNQNATFNLINNIAIYGGFPPGGGAWESRNPNDPNNETILSGDIGTPDVNTDNSYHVVTSSDTDETAVLDGFTVTGGCGGYDTSFGYYYGGGMCNFYGSPTITNCTFSKNSIYNSECGYGGGIYNYYGNPRITNCTFNENLVWGNDSQGYGGGMYNRGGNLTIINCAFIRNKAVGASGDRGYGGGLCNESGSLTITNSIFTENMAYGQYNSGFGGGIYNDSNATITNCIFSGNWARGPSGFGGGICNESNATITNCIFSGNWIESDSSFGGGIYNDSNATITNCIFSGNGMKGCGHGSGGGVCNNGSYHPRITNCTFNGNSATIYGGGMYNNNNSSPTVANCIFWDNTAPTGPQICNSSSTPAITYSDIQGGWLGTGNINADPCFVNANGLDGDIGTLDDNLRLLSASPCIDAGNNNSVPPDYADLNGNGNRTEPTPFDLDGFSRFIAKNCNGTAIVDMGAYEHSAVTAPGKATGPSPANSATGVVRTGTSLTWVAGSGATSHDVYFGTASTPPSIGNQTGTSYAIPGTMIQGKVYYWHIDEKNCAGTTTGDIWRFTVQECLKSTVTEYSAWVAWGKPSCWCFQRQCRGDVNGAKSGYWVALLDLNILKSAWQKNDTQLGAVTNGICADFNHSKSGYRVQMLDLNILKSYWQKPDTQVPCCDLDSNCILTPADKYLFWTN
jgi:hypothetical protein